jgi:hypothetical protein
VKETAFDCEKEILVKKRMKNAHFDKLSAGIGRFTAWLPSAVQISFAAAFGGARK